MVWLASLHSLMIQLVSLHSLMVWLVSLHGWSPSQFALGSPHFHLLGLEFRLADNPT